MRWPAHLTVTLGGVVYFVSLKLLSLRKHTSCFLKTSPSLLCPAPHLHPSAVLATMSFGKLILKFHESSPVLPELEFW